jgi:hypothetical protein
MRPAPFLTQLVPALIFLAGTGIGLLVWNHLTLPFSNPLEVVGPSALHQWNPWNNTLRFLVFCACPSCLLILFFFLFPRAQYPLDAPRKTPRPPEPPTAPGGWEAVVFFLFAVLVALNVPTYHAFGRFDFFHEGESLGAAVSWLQGQVPYRDFFFFHGVFQDPLRSALAFELFGRSIGAERALESLLKIMEWVLLAGLLRGLFWPRWIPAFAALTAVALLYVPFVFDVVRESFVFPHAPANILSAFAQWEPWFGLLNWINFSSRDLSTFVFLSALIGVTRQLEKNGAAGRVGLFGFSFLFYFTPWLALGDSLDRGLYLFCLSFLFSGFFHFSGLIRPAVKRFYGAGFLAGGTAGFLVLGFLLRWNYPGFFKFAFGELPRYKLMTDALEYPLGDFRFLFTLGALAFIAFRMVQKLLGLKASGKKSWAWTLEAWGKGHWTEGALALLAFFCFRNTLERPDLDHLAANSLWVALFLWVDFHKSVRVPFSKTGVRALVALGCLLALLCVYRLSRFDLLERNFPLGQTDESFLTPDRQATVAFLKKNLGSAEPFFAFSNDASWYYLLNRPTPTRYPCLWVAAPRPFQQEVIGDLEAQKTRLVLYKNEDWSSQIDGIPDVKRFPVIDQYLRKNYVPYRKIGDQEIWIRKAAEMKKAPAA